MWVRGLKQVTCADGQTRFVVAPHVGAWIETPSAQMERYELASHPMWVRGLKQHLVRHSIAVFSRTPCGCVD